MGDKVITLDFCLGEYDVIGIAEFPSDAAAAMSLAVNAPGHLRSYKTTRLLSAADFLAAQKQASGTSYKAPVKKVGVPTGGKSIAR